MTIDAQRLKLWDLKERCLVNDVETSCPHCTIPLVVTDGLKSQVFNCPHCNRQVQLNLQPKQPPPIPKIANISHQQNTKAPIPGYLIFLAIISVVCILYFVTVAVMVSSGSNAHSITGKHQVHDDFLTDSERNAVRVVKSLISNNRLKFTDNDYKVADCYGGVAVSIKDFAFYWVDDNDTCWALNGGGKTWAKSTRYRDDMSRDDVEQHLK